MLCAAQKVNNESISAYGLIYITNHARCNATTKAVKNGSQLLLLTIYKKCWSLFLVFGIILRTNRTNYLTTSGLLKIKLSTISGLETGQHRTVPRHRANRSATSSPTICMALPDAGGRRSNCRPSHQSTNYHQGIHRHQGFLLFCCSTGDGRTPTKAKSRPGKQKELIIPRVVGARS